MLYSYLSSHLDFLLKMKEVTKWKKKLITNCVLFVLFNQDTTFISYVLFMAFIHRLILRIAKIANLRNPFFNCYKFLLSCVCFCMLGNSRHRDWHAFSIIYSVFGGILKSILYPVYVFDMHIIGTLQLPRAKLMPIFDTCNSYFFL